ncbi:hypothetical protein NE237_005427 [Protea cynaroides]|uniref:Uncharacterized protein n=1 Tax=Protea cynaroides TaxID=273540 RepID=A0A9Q0QUF2_9MAGN|nr:hypothetical protein NE237_005427 [Protea cynaroides]
MGRGCWRADRWAGSARCELGTDGRWVQACGQMSRELLGVSWGQMGRGYWRVDRWAGGSRCELGTDGQGAFERKKKSRPSKKTPNFLPSCEHRWGIYRSRRLDEER